MSDTTTDAAEQGTATEPAPGVDAGATSGQADVSFSERYSDILAKVNSTLDQVDWSQMGRIGKATGVIVAVIVAQILIKGVLDTINLLPVVPGLLELLGLVVVGQWSWQNLTTSEKRGAVVAKVQNLRKEYLG
ncbi:CAAD domain-containing protein [Cyanobium sp. FACHB-13342]|uniref:CAAD domain-containing protein n=1 Tax=Cyanobium sp. FACHB-13342 TaxID=2692793 RepID=UPI0016819421|nr:CAAD domain-containing protein [Cyanobium sp. FACHB-13342]MBD2422417.1 CAAD domain-containing protein [Cyanobium sp. FACHB-13342]